MPAFTLPTRMELDMRPNSRVFYAMLNFKNICKAQAKLRLYFDRSSRPEVFCKKGFLEIYQNSQENTFFHRKPLVAASILKTSNFQNRYGRLQNFSKKNNETDRCFPITQ